MWGAAIRTQFVTGGLVLSNVQPDILSKILQDHLVISIQNLSRYSGANCTTFFCIRQSFHFLFTNTRIVSSSKDDRQTKISRFKICSIDKNSKNVLFNSTVDIIAD